MISQSVQGFASVLAGRHNDLTPIIEQSLKDSLKNQSEKFIDIFKDIVRQGALVNVTSCSMYFISILKLIQKFKSANFNLETIQEELENHWFAISTPKPGGITEDAILQYVTEDSTQAEVPPQLADLINASKAWVDVLEWANGVDKHITKTNKDNNFLRFFRYECLDVLTQQGWNVLLLLSFFTLYMTNGYDKLRSFAQNNMQITDEQFQYLFIALLTLGGVIAGMGSTVLKNNTFKSDNKVIANNFYSMRKKLAERLFDTINKFFDIKVVEYTNNINRPLGISLSKREAVYADTTELKEKKVKSKKEKISREEKITKIIQSAENGRAAPDIPGIPGKHHNFANVR